MPTLQLKPITLCPRKESDDEKRKSRQKIYNCVKWRRLRESKLKNSPLCEECEKRGDVTPAQHVHHIDSFLNYDDQTIKNYKAYDYANLMSLCAICHQKIHNLKSSRHERY